MMLSLSACRSNSGLTLREAAKLIGISYQTLQKYEKDSSNIPVSLLNKLSELYQVPNDYIFLGNKYDLIRTINVKRMERMG